jgi:predicted XRE-type DNA-binding protein
MSEFSQPFASIWDAIEETPEEAENMKLRATLMQAIAQHVREELLQRRGLSQSDAAQNLGMTQPRLSDLLRGKIGLFSIDALVGIGAKAGMLFEIAAITHHAA